MSKNTELYKAIKSIDGDGVAEAVRRTARAAVIEALEPISSVVQSTGVALHVVVQGYTPEWNDGEECEHSANAFAHFTEGWFEDITEGAWWSEEFDGDDFDGEDAAVFDEQIEAYGEPVLQDVERFFEGRFNDAVNSMTKNGTNYIVVFNFNPDGTIEIGESEWDCGY